MLPENIIYLTFLFYIPAYYLYLRDITHGQNRPNVVSWFMWTLGPITGAFLQFKAGAGLVALPTFMAGFGPLIVALYFLWHKNAYWKLTAFDFFCGGLSFLALIFYVLTQNLVISIIFAMLSDFLAAIPTVVKSWKFPEYESAQPYLIGVVTNLLGVLIIKNWVFSIYSFGIYLVMINLVLALLVYRKSILNMLYFRNEK